MSSSTRNLTDVPEEDAKSSTSPYSMTTPTASSSNVSVNTTHRTARKPPSVRTLGRSSNDQLPSASGSVKRVTSGSSSVVANGAKSKTSRSVISHSKIPSAPVQRYQANPQLPHDKDVEPAPSTVMYWSRAPVWGTIPMRTMRAHTVTLVDTTAWLFGGCDDKDGSKDIYCFDTGISMDYLTPFLYSTPLILGFSADFILLNFRNDGMDSSGYRWRHTATMSCPYGNLI